jgi:cyclase
MLVSLLVLYLAPEARTQAGREGRAAATAAAHNAPNGTHVTPIAPKFYLISDANANLLLLVDGDSSFVVGVQQPTLVKQALATLRELKAPPVKFALVIDDEHAPNYGDGGWGHRGATTLAHELLWARLRKSGSTPAPATDALGASSDIALPAMSFSQVVQLHITGEDTHVIHDRAGYSDADVVVHFERSGIAFLGPAFTSDGYPRIDTAHGGKLSGMIDTVDFFATNFARVPDAIEPIVPGHGPVAKMPDLQAYRDMLRTVHDRVRTLIRSGKSLQEVIAAKPTAEFDTRWGHGPVSPDQFVTMAVESVSKE